MSHDDELPNPMDLLRAGIKLGEITDAQRADLTRCERVEHRLAARVVVVATKRIEVDLAAFAAKAGMPLEEILAIPSDTRGTASGIDPMDVLRGRLRTARVPEKYVRLITTNAAYDTEPLLDAVKWASSDRWALVLASNVGLGKTMAGSVVLGTRRGGLYMTAEELVSPDGGNDLARQAKAAALLVLDEMGDETLTAVGSSRLREVIRDRAANERKTLLITNLDLDGPGQWAERYGSRLVDRLREGGDFIGYTGTSLRVSKPALRLVEQPK